MADLREAGQNRTISTDSMIYPESLVPRLDASLASFNSGTKSYITLKLAALGGTASLESISKPFQMLAARSDFRYKIDTPRLVSDYIRQNLIPLGFVAETEDSAFVLTEDGIRFGIPAAAFALDFEQHHDISLYQVFGKTGTASEHNIRTQLVRADILRILAHSAYPLGFTEISARTEYTRTTKIWSDVHLLATAGILERIPQKPRSVSIQHLQQDQLTILSACKLILKDQTELTAENIRTVMGLPDDPAILAIIEENFDFFMTEGLLSHHPRDLYTLSENGKLIYSKYLIPLVQFLSDYETPEITGLVPVVMRDLDGFGLNAFNAYAPFASSTKHEELKHVKPLILACIGDHPGGLTREELSGKIDHISDSLIPYIRELLASGKIKRIRVNRNFRYFLTQ